MINNHITLKDFCVGQKVYILKSDQRNETIVESNVVAVGRKYITVDYGYPVSKYSVEDYCSFGLIEKCEYGAAGICFPSIQALNDYKEKKELNLWLSNISVFGNKFSLEQLRKVKEILGR